jgi:hypothetical protein
MSSSAHFDFFITRLEYFLSQGKGLCVYNADTATWNEFISVCQAQNINPLLIYCSHFDPVVLESVSNNWPICWILHWRASRNPIRAISAGRRRTGKPPCGTVAFSFTGVRKCQISKRTLRRRLKNMWIGPTILRKNSPIGTSSWMSFLQPQKTRNLSDKSFHARKANSGNCLFGISTVTPPNS